jgi:8-oxo-dGTP pyrophosphatase MutT (NUDIX family)
MNSSRPRPKRAVRPRDAATLILVKKIRGRPAVLMGQRHSGHRFMPDQYVFPGGRVDRADHYAQAATPLAPHVVELLQRAAAPARAEALALAAVRETFEETGLILGQPMATPRRMPASWSAFYATGQGPALDALEYLTRAVTPPFRPIRFNARFFLADASRISGEIAGSGELLDLDFIPIARARKLQIPAIQLRVLETVAEFLAAPDEWRRRNSVPRYRMLHGKRVADRE